MTLGSELGTGLGAFAQQFIGTQNTLKQQQEQLAQQQRDNQYRDQQAMAQQQYQQAQLAQGQEQLDQQAARDQAALVTTGSNKRQTDFQNVIAPAYSDEWKGLNQTIATYGPKAGANFNPALYQHATDRIKQLQKLMQAVNLSTGNGEGYDEARSALLNFIGSPDTDGTVPGNPANTPPGMTTPPATQPAAPVPAPINYTFAPSGQAHGDTVANGAPPAAAPAAPTPPAASPATPTPAPTDLSRYATIQDVPPSTLLNADNAALVQRFGYGADEYAQNARAAYRTAAAQQQQALHDGQVKYIQTVTSKILDDPKHPATPAQLRAALTLNTLSGRTDELTPAEQASFLQALQDVAPTAMNAVSWGDVLASKDPATILAAYPMYQKLAPEVVQGFDPAPYQAQQTADLEDKASKAALARSSAKRNDTEGTATAQATTIKDLLSGSTSLDDVYKAGNFALLRKVADDPDALAYFKMTDGGAGLRAAADQLERASTAAIVKDETQSEQNIATTGSINATTDKTGADTERIRREDGVAMLGQLAATGATIYQLQHDGSNTWSHLKQQLHLNDGELAAVFQQARWEADQKAKGVVLTNTYKNSQILTDGAQRGLAIAQTGNALSTTRARDSKLQPELDLLNQQIANAELTGQDTASITARRNLLLPIDVQEGLARVKASNASATNSLASAASTTAQTPGKVAESWANVANLQSQIHTRNVTTNNDLALLKGKIGIQTATIGKLTADTLYTRAKDPNDPLYNPKIAAPAAGDPNAPVYKQAAALTNASKVASSQAAALNNQINAIVKRNTPEFGTYNPAKLSPEDAQTIKELTGKRDHLLDVANNRRNSADQLILNVGAGAVPGASGGQTPKVAPGLPAAQQWAAQHVEVPNVDSDCAAIAGMYLNDLGIKIAPSNNAAQLEKNAQAAKWTPQPLAGVQKGDMVVWTSGNGVKYGLTSGKHVGVVADVVNGVPQILMNPGRLSDGTQGVTTIKPMFDPRNAKAYRAPTAPAPTSAKPPPTVKPAVTAGTPLPAAPAPKPAAVDTSMPAGVKPVDSVKPLAGKLRAAGWFAGAAKVTTAEEADTYLNQAVKIMNPSATPEQIQVMKRDLARTMGW